MTLHRARRPLAGLLFACPLFLGLVRAQEQATAPVPEVEPQRSAGDMDPGARPSGEVAPGHSHSWSGRSGNLSAPALVAAPPGWVKGETHDHLQFCPRTFDPGPSDRNAFPLDQDTVDVLDSMRAVGLQVSNVMIWNNQALPTGVALQVYGPLVTGDEDPASTGDTERFIQVGVESSGWPVSTLGHVSFLGVSDAGFDPELDLPFQLIDWFRLQPDVVVGAPHQLFPRDLCSPLDGGAGAGFVNPPGESFLDSSVCDLVTEGLAFPTFTAANLFPVFLPLDIASERVDYLEAIDLTFDIGALGFAKSNTWYGLYYKLLDLGLRPSIGGGNDVNCAVTSSSLPARTYVWMDEVPLSFDCWAERLAAGYVTISMGDQEFLSLEVDDQPPGSELNLAAATVLEVRVELHAADGHDVNDRLELLVDGRVVETELVNQTGGGVYEFVLDLPFSKSSWVAARTASGSAHTGAVFVTVASQPQVDLRTANYMLQYTHYLDWNLDIAEQAGVVEEIVGDSLDVVRDYIADARSVFTSRRDFAEGLPPEATRFGRSTPAPGGRAMPIVLDESPVAGELRTITLFNGPPGGLATLYVSGGSAPGVFVQGVRLFIDTNAIEITLPAVVDDFGHASVDLLVPDSQGQPKYLQWVVTNPDGTGARFSASDAVDVQY